MYSGLPFSLVALLSFATLKTTAFPSFSGGTFGLRSSLSSLIPRAWGIPSSSMEKRQGTNFETGTNGSKFLWVIQDTYEGQTFFEWVNLKDLALINAYEYCVYSRWSFFSEGDPTQYVITLTILLRTEYSLICNSGAVKYVTLKMNKS